MSAGGDAGPAGDRELDGLAGGEAPEPAADAAAGVEDAARRDGVEVGAALVDGELVRR